MNRAEFDEFKERLFTAFPSFRTHINTKSDNPVGTLETWAMTLSTIELEEADAVLNSWLDGTVEPPKAFELDYVAILIRSRVGFKRNERSRYNTAKSLYDEQQAAKSRRESYKPLFKDLEKAFEGAKAAWERHKSGEITLQEWNQICKELTCD